METPLFLLPIVVGLLTQFSKRFFNKNWYHEYDTPLHLPQYGGMPSAHTAFATSLLTVAAYTSGFTSPLFAVSVVLAVFILDDALRMRIFLGRHGEALKKLIARLPEQEQQNFPHLEKKLGHKPVEALVGGAIGIIATLFFLYLLMGY